jgi:hypothetical protein
MTVKIVVPTFGSLVSICIRGVLVWMAEWPGAARW